MCLLDEPRQMANPRTAFRDNPFVDCSVHLDVAGVSPMYGGMPQYEDDDRRTELAEALWATTLDKLAVANPSYREDS